MPLNNLLVAALLVGCSLLSAQTDPGLTLPGLLKLVDQPPNATTVEYLTFHLHPLGKRGTEIDAQPDREGRFTLRKVPPGRYSLTFPMPGHIDSFSIGSTELAPDGFELTSGETGPLLLVIGTKTAGVSVTVQNFPADHAEIVALLAPADNHLTLRESCYLNNVSGPETTFRNVPPGKYRILIVDAQFQRDVAALAPHSADFLKNLATSIEVPASGRLDVNATYLDRQTVKESIRLSAPLPAIPR